MMCKVGVDFLTLSNSFCTLSLDHVPLKFTYVMYITAVMNLNGHQLPSEFHHNLISFIVCLVNMSCISIHIFRSQGEVKVAAHRCVLLCVFASAIV